MRHLLSASILFLLSMMYSCASIAPHTVKVIRVPVEHTYVKHPPGRLPEAFVATVPKEYWELAFPFESGDSKGIIMAGDAMVSSLRESMGTVFKMIRYYKYADFVAVVYLEKVAFTTVPGEKEGKTSFRLKIPVVFIDSSGNELFTVNLSAETSGTLPDDRRLATEEAARQVARLFSMIELDLAAQVREAWEAGKFKL